MSKKSFIKGAAILGISAMLVKIIGILYRIPLANILGDDGLGLYQTAYPFYTYLLMLSTAGLPPAISKLVAEKTAKGDHAGAKRVFRVSIVMLGTLGLFFAVVLYVLSPQIAVWVEDPLSHLAIATIAPALLLVSLMSSIRGYFQGLQNMLPTALSQVVEQIGKVIMGLYFAYKWIPRGIEHGAAGAVLGVVISEACALFFILIYYLIKRNKIYCHSATKENSFQILRRLSQLAGPILLGASVMPLVMLTDVIFIRDRLTDIGYTTEQARSLFGMFSGRVNTLFNVPGALSLAFCVSMVPAISSALARHDTRSINHNISQGYKIATMISIPSAFGLAVLATPIMDLLYGSKFSPEAIAMSGELLTIMSAGVIFLSILQTFNGVLQGLGRVFVPVVALGCGAAVKVVANIVLVGNPAINIYGAPIGTLLCYLVAAVIDIIMVKRITSVKLPFKDYLLRPIFASLLMGAAAWGAYHMLVTAIGGKPATIIAVLVGLTIFALCIPLLGILSRNEVLGLPGGRRLVKYYDALSKKKRT